MFNQIPFVKMKIDSVSEHILNIYVILSDKTNRTNNIILYKNEATIISQLSENSPETFQQIDAAVTEIAKDGKLDIHDIPQIILVIFTILKNRNTITEQDLLNVIKYIIDAILESDVLPIPQFEIIISQKIVDSCLDLLAAKLPEIETNKTWWITCNCTKN
jgi:hypothetical protein